MNTYTIILALMGGYIFYVSLVCRLIIPNFGFKKSRLPEKIPEGFKNKINELNRSSKTDLEYLKGTYEFLTNKYKGDRVETITKFWYFFRNVFSFESGYIPCTVFNYLLRVMLVKSGRFKEKDIRLIVVPFNFIAHQYLKVRVDDRWINVDPWAKHRGVPFGKRLFLFG